MLETYLHTKTEASAGVRKTRTVCDLPTGISPDMGSRQKVVGVSHRKGAATCSPASIMSVQESNGPQSSQAAAGPPVRAAAASRVGRTCPTLTSSKVRLDSSLTVQKPKSSPTGAVIWTAGPHSQRSPSLSQQTACPRPGGIGCMTHPERGDEGAHGHVEADGLDVWIVLDQLEVDGVVVVLVCDGPERHVDLLHHARRQDDHLGEVEREKAVDGAMMYSETQFMAAL